MGDLTVFINELKVKYNEFVLYINTNETFYPTKRDSDTCIRLPTH